MSGLAPGVRVRVAPLPNDLSPAHDTGTIVRAWQVYDPVSASDRDSGDWLVCFDGLHFERAIPMTHLTLLDS